MIPVVYSDYMVAEAKSFSPSSTKPKMMVFSWMSRKEPIQLIQPRKATKEELYKAHDPEYVDGVLDLTIADGFGTKSRKLADSLLYTTGGMLTALGLVRDGAPVVCVPVSGFHHAHRDSGGGFCTFNGLMVAALSTDMKVAIVDCDMHYGDGTDDILASAAVEDRARIKHYTFGREFHGPSQGVAYINKLRYLWDFGWFDGTEVILYQAGADVHVNDPLGGVLTTIQMIERDRLMFEGAKDAGIPIIWNLAGGYQTPVSKVLDLHHNTMQACKNVFCS